MSERNSSAFENIQNQAMSSLVYFVKSTREAACETLTAVQEDLYEQACTYIETVRQFIDRPEGILGSVATKHGEIAEVAEVGVRNALDTLKGAPLSANLHPLRFGPVDYQVDGVDVQSKFLNGLRNTLAAVKEHASTYNTFSDGNSYYAIPKDQHELLQEYLQSHHAGLSQKAIKALEQQISEIEKHTGRSIEDVVRPALFDYREAQQGAIDATLDKKQAELAEEKELLVQDIQDQHAASWQEGLKVVGVAAGVGASVAFVRTSFSKYQQGKNIFKGEFTMEDWKDVGLESVEGAAIGGVTGGALYLMTNCANMSAPLAGAMVSAVKGLAPLVDGYRTGAISMEQLIDSGCMVCAEVGMVAAATAIGQVVIPVPVVGALIGSIAGQVLASILSREVQGTAAAIEARVAVYTATLSAKQKLVLDGLRGKFERLGELTTAAFDVRVNADILASSARLARAYRVNERKLLLTANDVDRFILTRAEEVVR